MTSRLRRITMVLLILASFAALAGTVAWGQTFPNKPIRIIVPTSAGGDNDFIACMIAKKLEDSLGWTIVVGNKPGASGIIAAGLVAKSSPDGYSILFNGPPMVQVAGLYKMFPFAARLHAEFLKALQQVDVADKFRNMGFEIGGHSQAQFAAQVLADHGRWTQLIQRAGVSLD